MKIMFQGLAGVMTWSIDTDDFLGKCNGNKFPLLRTMNNALFRREKGYDSSAGISKQSIHFIFGLFLALYIAAGF